MIRAKLAIPAPAFALAALATIASGTAAMTMPMPAAAQDSRLVERMYDPGRVVTIEGRTKVQASIMFADDESIENVAIGDSNAWQVTPNKRANLLFIKPLNPTARTNLTVITDRHTYFFDLVASPRAKPMYALRFLYPAEPEPEAEDAPMVAEGANALEQAAVNDPFAVVDPALLNFDWAGSGDEKLLPARIFDDGDATFLTWPRDRPVPAVLVKDYEGTEGPVNFTVRGETIVVVGVPKEIVLRSGDEMATLVNQGPPRVVAPSPQANARQSRSQEGRPARRPVRGS